MFGALPRNHEVASRQLLHVVFDVVPPAIRRQVRIREQDLADTVGVLDRDGLAFARLAGIVVQLR